MASHTYRYFTCLSHHQGHEKTSESDQPYGENWESTKIVGLVAIDKDERGYATYKCEICGKPMVEFKK